MTTNFVLQGTKIFAEFVKDLIYFPLWWYSVGFLKIINLLRSFLVYSLRVLGIAVWLKNLFRPMYGQKDIAGALISFFMRIFQIIIRSIGFVILSIIAIILGLIWLVAPVIVVYELIYQLI